MVRVLVTGIQAHLIQYRITAEHYIVQLSGLEETLEYFEIEEKFANQKPKDLEGNRTNDTLVSFNLHRESITSAVFI